MNVTSINTTAKVGVTCTELSCEAATQICLTLVSVVIISVGIYGNGIICLLVYQKPSMRSAINILLAILAVTDFVTVIYSVTISTLTVLTNHLLKWTLGSQTLCYVHALIHLWFLVVNATVLTMITIDRYVIITKRREFLSRSQVKTTLIFISIFALVSSLVSLIPPMGYRYVAGSAKCVFESAETPKQYIYAIFIYILTFLAPFLVMIFTCGRIVFVVKRNYARINLYGHNSMVYRVSAERYKYCQPKVDLRFKTRTFYNIAILCFIFVVCRGPYCSYVLFMNLQGSFSPFLHVLLLWLNYLNPALNSLICVWRIRKFRKRFLLYFTHFCYCGDFEIRPSLKVKPLNVMDQFNSKDNFSNSI